MSKTSHEKPELRVEPRPHGRKAVFLGDDWIGDLVHHKWTPARDAYWGAVTRDAEVLPVEGELREAISALIAEWNAEQRREAAERNA